MLTRIETLALAGLVSLGCEQPNEAGRSDEVRLFYYVELATHSQETIDGAAEILGLDLEVSSDSLRSVIVFYIPGLPEDGEQASSDVCGRTLWCGDNDEILAHELGHALGLEHVDDPNNLMGPNIGPELTDKQIDTMRWAAWWLENECAQE